VGTYRYKKNYRITKKRFIFKNGLFWFFSFVLVILGVIIYFLFFSSFFQIKTLQFLGNEKTSFKELNKVILEKEKNIFLINLSQIKDNILKKYPYIEKVSFQKKLPNILNVQIEERKPAAIFCSIRDNQETCYFIDNKGVIFEPLGVDQFPLEMVKIKEEIFKDLDLGQVVIDSELIKKILKINSQLKNLEIPAEEFLLVFDKRLNVKTCNKWEIYFSLEKDLDLQLNELEVLLKEENILKNRKNIEYIDLRFNKIFIYPENKT